MTFNGCFRESQHENGNKKPPIIASKAYKEVLPHVHDYYELSDKGVLIEEYIDGMKLSNIICTSDGDIKLIDFGAAREYKDGVNRDTVYVGIVGIRGERG